MFERLTDDGRRVVSNAFREARKHRHTPVTTCHLLAAVLADDGDSTAKEKLAPATFAKVDQYLQRVPSQAGVDPADTQHANFSEEMKVTIGQALREALMLGHDNVTPSHLMLAMAKKNDTQGHRLLSSLGYKPESIAVRFDRYLRETPNPATSGTTATAGNVSETGSGPSGKALTEFCRDLTEEAREGRLDPLVGRTSEVDRALEILCRRSKNNPVFVGEPGVGKTAIVEGLAQALAAGDVPSQLSGMSLLSLDVSSLVAGTRYRGDLEQRLKDVAKQAANSNVILFIDEMHAIAGSSNTTEGGGQSIGDVLKPALARGELSVIGATTTDEYRKHVEKDKALARRFQKVDVEPLSVADTIEVLDRLAPTLEGHHQVVFDAQVTAAAAKLSERYIADRFLPDKAVDVLDEAAARVSMRRRDVPEELVEVERDVQQSTREAAAGQDVSAQLTELLARRDELIAEYETDNETSYLRPVRVEDVTAVVSTWSKVPVEALGSDDKNRLMELEAELACRVVGQDHVVSQISKAVRRQKAGLSAGTRPAGSFLFVGPTGVGKTETARALAQTVYGSKDALIRVDMSELMEEHSVSKLIGAPPGYVGFNEGGQLTELVRRRPYSVVLFDEVEKAHPRVLDVLLQLLEEGQLTDAQGRTVSFSHTMVICTGNVGSTHRATRSVGFTTSDTADADARRDRVQSELEKAFRPEMMNRFDEIVIFDALGPDELAVIAELMVAELASRVEDHHVRFLLTEQARAVLVEEGTDERYGARPLRRAVRRLLEDQLAELLLSDRLTDSNTIHVDVADDDSRQLRLTPQHEPVHVL